MPTNFAGREHSSLRPAENTGTYGYGYFFTLTLTLLITVLFLPAAPAQNKQPDKSSAKSGAQKSSLQNKSVASKAAPQPGPTVSQTQTLTLRSDRANARIGEDVKFTFAPTNIVGQYHNRFILHFGDGMSQDIKPGEPEIVHFYREARRYKVSVEIVPPVGNKISGPEPVEVEVRNFTLSASPLKIKVGEKVSFQTVPVSKDPHIKYLFEFGDGNKTEWQSKSQAGNIYYSAGDYTVIAYIRRAGDDGTVEDLGNVPPINITVRTKTRNPTVTPTESPPLPPVPTPTPTPDIFGVIGEWLFYAAPFLVCGLVGALGLFSVYKISKWLFTPRPTFTAHPDLGQAYVASVVGLSIDTQLSLNANTAAGAYQLIVNESQFVKSVRRNHV
jgi:hypothetical protein